MTGVLIIAGCVGAAVLLGAIGYFLRKDEIFRSSGSPATWLGEEDLPPSISELIMKDQARKANVVPMRSSQLPRRATKSNPDGSTE